MCVWIGLKIGVSMHWIACFSYTPHWRGGKMGLEAAKC